jgi:hypothetical protein
VSLQKARQAWCGTHTSPHVAWASVWKQRSSCTTSIKSETSTTLRTRSASIPPIQKRHLVFLEVNFARLQAPAKHSAPVIHSLRSKWTVYTQPAFEL